MRKTGDQRLKEAYAYIAEVSKNYKVALTAQPGKPSAKRDTTLKHLSVSGAKKELTLPSARIVRNYHNFDIIKESKGHFKVKADGQMIERRFKSMTAAEEWCAAHGYNVEG